jgi:hypothetical protein
LTRQAQNDEAERQCVEIRLRAEREWGRRYAASEKAEGAREPGTNRGTTRSNGRIASTLADYGVSKQQSADWH